MPFAYMPAIYIPSTDPTSQQIPYYTFIFSVLFMTRTKVLISPFYFLVSIYDTFPRSIKSSNAKVILANRGLFHTTLIYWFFIFNKLWSFSLSSDVHTLYIHRFLSSSLSVKLCCVRKSGLVVNSLGCFQLLFGW